MQRKLRTAWSETFISCLICFQWYQHVHAGEWQQCCDAAFLSIDAMNEGAYVNTPLEIILNSTLSNALLNLQRFDEVSAVFLCNVSGRLCFTSSCVAKPRHSFLNNQHFPPAFIVVKLDLWYRTRTRMCAIRRFGAEDLPWKCSIGLTKTQMSIAPA